MSTQLGRAFLWSLLALLAPVGSEVLLAQSWRSVALEQVRLPTGAPTAGFTCSITTESPRLFGDLPLRVSIRPTARTFAAQRELVLRLVLDPLTVQPRWRNVQYTLPIRLAEGSTEFDETFYLPKWCVGGEFSATILEAGRPLPDHTARWGGAVRVQESGSDWWRESAMGRFGWIADAVVPGSVVESPDLRYFFAAAVPESYFFYDFAMPITLVSQGLDPWRSLQYVNVDELATDWRWFDGRDVWVCRQQTLDDLRSRRTDAADALAEYLRCGGTLWVVDADDRQKASIEQWLGLGSRAESRPASALAADQAAIESITAASLRQYLAELAPYVEQSYAAPETPARYLRQAANDRLMAGQLGAASIAGGNPFSQASQTLERYFIRNATLAHSENAAVAPPEPAHFDQIEIGLGRVIVSRYPEPLPGSLAHWQSLMGLTGPAISETVRKAVDPVFGDRRFWDWVIPGVAQPPIYTFMGLLALFVILVGPVAYRSLSRMGRAYLMFFVAPLLAAVTTLGMLIYGLLADGLSTQVRVREVTWVANAEGDAARYCRSAYFAGIRPSGGLRFPANSSVIPYDLSDVRSWYEAYQRDAGTVGSVTLTNEEIRLDRGFLPSRSQRQFVTYRPISNFGGIVRTAAGGQELRSRFDRPVTELILRDLDGKYWYVPRMDPVDPCTMKPLDDAAAGERLSGLYALQRPTPPAAITSTMAAADAKIDLLVELIVSRVWQAKVGSSAVSAGESAIENWLRQTLQIESELPEGKYVALMDVTADCIAVPSANLVESVHYVVGDWQ